MTTATFTIKKHWTVYIVPSIFLLAALFFVYLSFGIKTKWISVGMLVFASFTAVSKIMKILNLASVSWTFNGRELQVRRGVLSWKKTLIQIPIFDIYDSSISNGFLGHYLNFGHISIRRTEGMTSQLSERHMAGALNFSGHVNHCVQEYKKGQNLVNSVKGESKDVVMMIQRLVDLKNTGVLSEEEFERLKKKVIEA